MALFVHVEGLPVAGGSPRGARSKTSDITSPGRVAVWDVASGKERWEIVAHADAVVGLEFLPDGSSVVSAGADGTVRIWETMGQWRWGVEELPGPKAGEAAGTPWLAWSFALSPGGDALALCGRDGSLRILDTVGRKEIGSVEAHGGGAYAAAFSPDGAALATAGADGSIRTWDRSTLRPRLQFPIEGGPARTLAYSPDGALLAAASAGAAGGATGTSRQLSLFQASTGRLVARVRSAHDIFPSLRFAPDGRSILAPTYHDLGEKGIRAWDVASLLEPSRLGEAAGFPTLAFSPDGRILAAATREDDLLLWEEGSPGKTSRRLRVGGGPQAIAFHPKRNLVAVSGTGKTVTIRDLDGGDREVARLGGHFGVVRALQFDPRGDVLAVASYRKVRLWSGADFSQGGGDMAAHDHRVHAIGFLPDSGGLATAGGDGRVRIWRAGSPTDASTWTRAADFDLGDVEALSLDVSLDGTLIAAGLSDGTIRSFSPAGARELEPFTGHGMAVTGVSFSPDGRVLASASSDATVRLWDVATRRERVALTEGDEKPFSAIRFSPDGTRLAACELQGVVRVWHALREETTPMPMLARSPRVPPPRSEEDVAPSLAGTGWTDVAAGPLLGDGGCQAAAWGDYDGDGDLDLFLGYNGRNRLLRNDGGVFADATPPILGAEGETLGAAWGDCDGDGDLDLVVASVHAPCCLYRNDGAGTLATWDSAFPAPLPTARAASWIDLDLDGDLDLLLTGVQRGDPVYRSDGAGHFVPWPLLVRPPARARSREPAARPWRPATARSGDGSVPATFLSARCRTWCDFDSDGDLDLHLGYASEPGRLFRFDGPGAFSEVTPTALAVPSLHGMAWGDAEADGDPDVFLAVSNGWNQLLLRTGDGKYVKAWHGALGHFGWGAAWVDHDNDGDEDLLVISNKTPSGLLRNDGVGNLWDATGGVPFLASEAYALAWADYDSDGDLDLFLSCWAGANRLLRNDSAAGSHWLHVDLEGTVSNRRGIGARVAVSTGGHAQVRAVTGSGDGGSQDWTTAAFGLGTRDKVDFVEVRWPSGIVQRLESVDVDRKILVREKGP